MSGDYTRFTHRPDKGYTGVLHQQGRVTLDADHNEQVEIADRRTRVGTLDAMAATADSAGKCVVPATTPDAFKISGPPDALEIGGGRAYVDGILVECRGDPSGASAFDPHLGEDLGSEALPYSKQPFFYAPDFPKHPGTGRRLVYLDVWQREVTVVEDPDLREPALGGPDTTTRLQTAWQVKVLAEAEVPEESGCDTPFAAWTDLTAPSTGRLSTKASTPTASASPCIVDPAGGYLGLENRLYRVEIHTSGTVGGADPARFKWSRDNASVVLSVKDVTSKDGGGCTVTLDEIGRDAFTRLEVEDLVELLDDDVELAIREKQEGGTTAKIISVDPENATVDLDNDLSALLNPDANRHRRLRRWDASVAAPDALRSTQAAALDLEDGVTITFGPDEAATLRAGDYWLFYARTATGKIEELHSAPPRPTHHYARLAVVDDQGVAEGADCREHWPPAHEPVSAGEGCCKVVRPGESIQDAIDAVKKDSPRTGGCVCLKSGVHVVDSTIVISGQKIVLHGESVGTTVRYQPPAGTESSAPLSLSSAQEVTIKDIRFEAGVGFFVQIVNASGVTISNCDFVATSVPQIVAIVAMDTRDLVIEKSLFSSVSVGVRLGDFTGNAGGGACTNVRLERNRLLQPFNGNGTTGFLLGSVSGSVEVLSNQFDKFPVAIALASTDGRAVIAGNVVTRIATTLIAQATLSQAYAPLIALASGAAPEEQRAFAIASAAPTCLIVDNRVAVKSRSHGGIWALGRGSRIERNTIDGSTSLSAASESSPVGILVRRQNPQIGMDDVVVRANVITSLQAGISIDGGKPQSARAWIDGNTVDARNTPADLEGGMIALSSIEDARVTDNLIIGGLPVDGQPASAGGGGASVGIELTDCTSPLIARNRISSVSTGVSATRLNLSQIDRFRSTGNIVRRFSRVGFSVKTVEEVELVDDVGDSDGQPAQGVVAIVECPRTRLTNLSTSGGDVGISVRADLSLEAEVTNCEVKQARLGLSVSGGDVCHVRGNRIGSQDTVPGPPSAGMLLKLRGEASRVEIADNVVTGVGDPCLQLERVQHLIMGNNRFLWFPGDLDTAAVVINGGLNMSLVGNHVGSSDRPSIRFIVNPQAAKLAAVSNFTSGRWDGVPNQLLPPVLKTLNFIL